MAIIVRPVQRVNPRDTSGERKWYAVQKTVERVGEDKVAEDIADGTTLNPAEALMAIRQLCKILARHLLDSKSVELGNWGKFSVSIKSSPADSKSKLTLSNIEKVNIRFTPGDAIKSALEDAEFAWVEKDSSEEEEEEETSSDSSSTDEE